MNEEKVLQKRKKCQRIGCGRFTYNLKKTQVGTKRLELCPNCRALLLYKASQKLERASGLGKVAYWITEMSRRALSDTSGEEYGEVGGVTLWFPWKRPPQAVIDRELDRS